MNDTQVIEFSGQGGQRLDIAVTERLTQLSRAQVQTLIKEGGVTVNGATVKPSAKLRAGDAVRIVLPEVKKTEILPENIPLDIVYEDDDLVVINKPAGLVVHLGTGIEGGTLVNALLARYPEVAFMQNGEGRQGIVHRLDKDTSGLLMIARNDPTQRALVKQFQERTVHKRYIALLEHVPKTPTGRIEAPIGRDRTQRRRMAVVREGKPAMTEYRVTDTHFRDDYALVDVDILTGRTHQIRVHMAFIGCPVVGDRVYGHRKQRVGLKRHFLHAAHLQFTHPRTNQPMQFESPLPPELRAVLDKLRP